MQSSSCRAGKWQLRLPWWSLCWDSVAEYSNIPENSETTIWRALKKKMWPSDLHGFDVGPCGNEPAKPSSPKKTVGLRQETHDSNRAIPEYWHIIGIQSISESSSQHVGKHTGNRISHLRNHFRRRVRIHEEPPKSPSRRSQTKQSSWHNLGHP